MSRRGCRTLSTVSHAPYWLLIAVLASTRPLGQALSMRLYHAALELHKSGRGSTKLSGDLATGEVRSLGKSLGMGSIGGPGFEAELETPEGRLGVKFLLTRQALDAEESAPQPQSLN